MREPSFSRILGGDGGIGVWEFASAASMTPTATAVLCHATGFHARCWDPIVARLPESWRVLAIDLRGHGTSWRASEIRPVRWKQFGQDVADVLERLGVCGAIGVGHSMGGHSTLHAAALQPESFSRLVLLDPVILPPQYYGERLMTDHYARKRRNQWASGDEMFDRYQGRPPFDVWDRDTLASYCRFALRDDGSGRLACDPDFEASVYEACSDADSSLYGELASVRVPVVVMRSAEEMGDGEFDMNWSPCNPGLAAALPAGVDIKVPLGHFIPMEDPDRTARTIVGML